MTTVGENNALERAAQAVERDASLPRATVKRVARMIRALKRPVQCQHDWQRLGVLAAGTEWCRKCGSTQPAAEYRNLSL